MQFHKMESCRNDFVIIESQDKDFLTEENIRRICDRKRGVGCDQLLLLSFISNNLIEMETYNQDGTKAGFCGNGARCIAGLAFNLGRISEKFCIKNGDDFLNCSIQGENVSIEIGHPKEFISRYIEAPHSLQNIAFMDKNFDYVDIGNRHLVVSVNSFDFDIEFYGSKIQKLSEFGINVNFVKEILDNEIEVRTYENGAGLTDACGSGGCASSFAYLARKKLKDGIVKVNFKNPGDQIQINLKNGSITMIGGFNYVFLGEIKNLSSFYKVN
jgi:diaminopimelate epimerase